MIKARDDGRVFIEGLLLESTGAPGRAVALYAKQVFAAPRNAMQRSAIFAGGDFAVGFARLRLCALVSEGDDAVKLRVESLEAFEIHRGEIAGRDAFCADQLAELADVPETYAFEVF